MLTFKPGYVVLSLAPRTSYFLSLYYHLHNSLLLFTELSVSVLYEGGAHILFLFTFPVSNIDPVSNIYLINTYWINNTAFFDFGKLVFVRIHLETVYEVTQNYTASPSTSSFILFSYSRLISVPDIQRALGGCWLNSRSSLAVSVQSWEGWVLERKPGILFFWRCNVPPRL